MFDLVGGVGDIEGTSVGGGPALGDHNVEWSVGGNGITISIVEFDVVDIWATSEWWHVPRGGFDKAVEGIGTGNVDTVRLAEWNTSLDLLERIAPFPSVGGHIIISSFTSVVVVVSSMSMVISESSNVTSSMKVGDQMVEVERAATAVAAMTAGVVSTTDDCMRMTWSMVVVSGNMMMVSWGMMVMMVVMSWSIVMMVMVVMVSMSTMMMTMSMSMMVTVTMTVMMMTMVMVVMMMVWHVMVMMPSMVGHLVLRQELD
jgi:hypothetical protein